MTRRLLRDIERPVPWRGVKPIHVRYLVMLQNAWSSYYSSITEWGHSNWLCALQRSRAGRRLVRITYGFERDYFDNTTATVVNRPHLRVPPDEDYVKETLQSVIPRAVLACGLQAEKVMKKLWQGPLVVMPHPCYRLVTNELLDAAREMLLAAAEESDGAPLRVKLIQERGSFKTIFL